MGGVTDVRISYMRIMWRKKRLGSPVNKQGRKKWILSLQMKDTKYMFEDEI